ncbi:MAG: helix-turn-helix transcriptional regulator [Bacteroidales bacterium]|jgi:transcriptional regulator with XRE-family HTH domain
MATLKEIRTELGLKQSDIASKLQKSIPEICNYENGVSLPELTDMVILERNFTQVIDWSENISKEAKSEIMNDLVVLSQYYPLTTVLTFAQKAIREGTKLGDPGCLIKSYLTIAKNMHEEPLKYNTGFNQ